MTDPGRVPYGGAPQSRPASVNSPTARRVVLIAAMALLLAVSGCMPTGRSAAQQTGDQQVTMVASATSTEPAPRLSAAARTKLREAADSDNANVVAMASDGDPSATLPLTPRRKNNQVEHGFHRESLIDQNLSGAEAALSELQARTPGLDLLAGVSEAVRGRAPSTLIVVSNGLSTRGALDLRELGWAFEPKQVVDALRDEDLLPDLSGWQVLYTNLGDTVGSQPALPAPTRDRLIKLWLAICHAAGAASCEADTVRQPTSRAASSVPTPIVPVPTITSVKTPSGRTTTTIPDTLLGFEGNSAAIDNLAEDMLADLARKIEAASPTTITVTGYTADPPGSSRADCEDLSDRRARAVERVLADHGLTRNLTTRGGGVAPGLSSVANGRYDPARAAQMRRVEITY